MSQPLVVRRRNSIETQAHSRPQVEILYMIARDDVCSVFMRRPRQDLTTTIKQENGVSVHQLHNPHFPALTQFKNIYIEL